MYIYIYIYIYLYISIYISIYIYIYMIASPWRDVPSQPPPAVGPKIEKEKGVFNR